MRMMFTDYPSRTVLGPGVVPGRGRREDRHGADGARPDYTHAWFMGYGPIDDPEIAFALFVEHGGSSSRVAVPLARDFFVGLLRRAQRARRRDEGARDARRHPPVLAATTRSRDVALPRGTRAARGQRVVEVARRSPSSSSPRRSTRARRPAASVKDVRPPSAVMAARARR
jgi:hypothetical protein